MGGSSQGRDKMSDDLQTIREIEKEIGRKIKRITDQMKVEGWSGEPYAKWGHEGNLKVITLVIGISSLREIPGHIFRLSALQ